VCPGNGRNDNPIDLGGYRREGRIKVRTIKLIGLTALAALTAMALVGVSSAMAEGSTALCSADPVGTEVCPAGNLVAHVHEESVGKAKLLSSSLNVECNVLFLGDASPTLGNPLVITGKFTYTNCTSGCTVTEQSASSTTKVLKLGHELADITGEGQVKLTCAFGFIKCVYNGAGLKGHGLGPLLTSGSANGEVRLEEQETHIVSGSCPEKAFLDLLTAPLTATYIKS
jgi:hypothetical protein